MSKKNKRKQNKHVQVHAYDEIPVKANFTPQQELEDNLLRPEIGKYDTFHFKNYLRYTPNRDILLQDLSKDVEIYQEMMKDGIVKSSLHRKMLSCISQDWQIVVNEEDYNVNGDLNEEAKRVIDFVTHVINNFQPHRDPRVKTISSFRIGLTAIADALVTGYSIVEKVWTPIIRGKWAGKIGLTALKGKDPINYRLKLDEFNNIEHITNIYYEFEILDANRFIIFPYLMNYSDPHGTSDLQAAHRAYKFKAFLFKVMAIASEKFAMPIAAATEPQGTKQTQRTAIRDILRKMQKDSSIVLPYGWDIKFLENKMTDGGKGFIELIAMCNKEILMAIEGTAMHVLENRQTGSRNIGLVAADQADLFVWHLSKSIEEIINSQLIPDIVELNWDTQVCPRFEFIDPGDVDLIRDSQIDESLLGMGVELSRADIRNRYSRPEPKNEQDTIHPINKAEAIPVQQPTNEPGQNNAKNGLGNELDTVQPLNNSLNNMLEEEEENG